jgi:hypothetical protein
LQTPLGSGVGTSVMTASRKNTFAVTG